MFIVFITLLLVNMAAGLVILAIFFLKGLGSPGEKSWAPGLAMVGAVACAAGFYMAVTWPITKAGDVNLAWANPTYGEMSVLLGVLFLGAALAVAKEWSLLPVAIYGLLAGVVAMVLGVRIVMLGLSSSPPLTGAGFILTGLGGPLALAIVLAPGRTLLRRLATACLLAAAGLWLLVAVLAYWMHLAMWSK
jgi:putative membrane protein